MANYMLKLPPIPMKHCGAFFYLLGVLKHEQHYLNVQVCKNGSSHLRGNVYIHYKSLDSALAAYQSINGRYFAGKQVLYFPLIQVISGYL